MKNVNALNCLAKFICFADKECNRLYAELLVHSEAYSNLLEFSGLSPKVLF